MGAQRLSKENRLYWMGRYAERNFMTIDFMGDAYDESLDGEPFDYVDWCERMQIPCVYQDVREFLYSYLFDSENPNSALSSLNKSFDNAVMLRNVITSPALAYLQMAKNVMDNAEYSSAPMLDLQLVSDYLMAFKGCVDERVRDESDRNTIKCGFTVERIDMLLRLGYRTDTDELEKEFERLSSRLRRTRFARDGRRLQLMGDLVSSPDYGQNKEILLDCVEHLFPDA